MIRFESNRESVRAFYNLLDLLHILGVNTRPLPSLRYFWDQSAHGGGGAEFIVFNVPKS